MAVSLDVISETKFTHTKALDLGTYTNQIRQQYTKSLSTSDVSVVFHDARTAGTSGETLVLTAGLEDAYGDSVVFANLKHVYIENLSATNSLLVGGGVDAALGTDTYTVSALGCVQLTSTFAISSGAKNLVFAGSGASVNYRVILIGN